jgi:hypothetical protein
MTKIICPHCGKEIELLMKPVKPSVQKKKPAHAVKKAIPKKKVNK